MKKILGLDLGTNSIGWAVVNATEDEEGNIVIDKISKANSRIIPMDQATIGDFNKGNSKSQTAERTRLRGARRLLERSHIRRERLNRVLSIIGWLPPHYSECLDKYGKILNNKEPKLAWKETESGNHEFIFPDSFKEMMEDFARHNPSAIQNGRKVPYDWTLYYLRKKALTRPVSKYELAWILMSFNQKRGYYQLREEEEKESTKKLEEYYSLKVTEVIETGEKKGKESWFDIVFENGWTYRKTFNEFPDWVGKVKDFIVTTEMDADGKPKLDDEGKEKRTFRIPKDDDWTLLKKKTEHDIDQCKKTVGEFIYDSLLVNPSEKIKGKLVRTVERDYYKEELKLILEKQMELNPGLLTEELYGKCIMALYPNNEAYRNSIAGKGFKYLFVNDIIFYQRPLKSKKSLISDCPLEERIYVGTDGRKVSHIKCAPKSNPYFQEFRLWQFLSSLRILKREEKINGSLKENVDVTAEFIPDNNALAELFCWLNDKEQIDQKALLSYLSHQRKNIEKEYRWNYVESKKYPANETRGSMLKALKKAGVSQKFNNSENLYALWHILYSVNDKKELKQALGTFAQKHDLPKEFVEIFSKLKPYEKDYASYSEKALKRLLTLMRAGKYWSPDAIDPQTEDRIEKILSGEIDENISTRVREKAVRLQSKSDFQGLPTWLACYIIYNRHSESKNIDKWNSPDDIDRYLANFKQHSLRNPIVESVITETLRTVRDIWKEEGRIDEIHIELGREMKNPAEKRKRITEQALKNEYTNLRIRAMLTEFMNPEFDVDNVRQNSSLHQKKLRIYENTVLESADIPDEIDAILKKFNNSDITKYPTTSEVLRYKAWLEQQYRSPYTGEIIPLGKLFTPEYEIEHIIPKKLYFDDSFNNKVICEAEVNTIKDKSLGYSFIKSNPGKVVTLCGGRQVQLLSVEEYEDFVRKTYKNNPIKKQNLLAEEIPEGFIQRQLNDSRYISKIVKTLLSNIVREKDETEDISKNVIVCNGSITSRLKKDWGLNDLWKDLMLPRFERMNTNHTEESFTTVNGNGRKVPTVPFSHQRGFDIKRIDHRHHAMDAIIIACANRNIINYLNNSSACRNAEKKRDDLQRMVCTKTHPDANRNYKWVVNMPSPLFLSQVRQILENCIISFKQNLRIINRTSNRYEKIENGKKVLIRQTRGDRWAIRKPMHKDTVYGKINLRKIQSVKLQKAIKDPKRIVRKDIKAKLLHCANTKDMLSLLKSQYPDIQKLDIYYYTSETKNQYFATRKALDSSFDEETIEKNIADSGIQKILLRHLEQCGNNPEAAFSPDGIDRMNANIVELNDGRFHQPIFKVRKYEKANKFPIGDIGNKSSKFVEAEKGTNLFFGIYISEEGKRSYKSIPLIEAIQRQKEGLSPVPESDGENKLLFYLSPDDLVYLPTADELECGHVGEELDKSRIYKMVSCSDYQCFFIHSHVAKTIVDKKEFSKSNKMEKAITGEMIKEICIPLKVDRLGNIIDFNGSLR